MPSETPEPTQEELNKARHILWKIDLRGPDGAWLSAQAAIADALAAEAAPLREEIERLTKEVAQSDALLSGREQLRAAAVAMVLSLEKKLAEALAAASRAREEQGALRAALEAADRLITGVYRDWETSGGPDVCEHGYAAGIPCERCDHATFNAALAPPTAESQENQQQLTGKGAK